MMSGPAVQGFPPAKEHPMKFTKHLVAHYIGRVWGAFDPMAIALEVVGRKYPAFRECMYLTTRISEEQVLQNKYAENPVLRAVAQWQDINLTLAGGYQLGARASLDWFTAVFFGHITQAEIQPEQLDELAKNLRELLNDVRKHTDELREIQIKRNVEEIRAQYQPMTH
jgi:hypothetical protein